MSFLRLLLLQNWSDVLFLSQSALACKDEVNDHICIDNQTLWYALVWKYRDDCGSGIIVI